MVELSTQIDTRVKKYISYGLAVTAVALIVTGIYVPSARDYLVVAAKMLLTTVGMAAQ